MLLVSAVQAAAQTDHQHDMTHENSTPWMVMQDGVVFGLFNHQSGSRGGDQFVAPNWWMGMATRPFGGSSLTLTAMLSLDPATVGRRGYRELFQVGEAIDGLPLVDRQHPHDFFMQLAAAWRLPLGEGGALTIAGGPVGEPALGPIAFMHRASAAENPFAPLGHHTFDSTHIAFGVVTAALERGPWTVEGSVFNGREPDANRWDFDFGAMDSLSARLWFKPTAAFEVQVSTGHLVDPEELSPGNVERTTASANWLLRPGADSLAVTAGWGMNAAHGTRRHALFAEATRRFGATAVFGRAEAVQLETNVLLNAEPHPDHDSGEQKNAVGAFTIGATRDVGRWRGFEGAFGASATFYAPPEPLVPTHGRHPLAFQLFFRIRPPAGHMGRMTNMRMGRPMA